MTYITAKNIITNPDILFVFGDNDMRTGKGGMAKEFRGHPNSIGIRTKHKPDMKIDSFYSDDNFEDNCRKIDEDIKFIKDSMKKYLCLYIPDGIGSGFAKLDTGAPDTYKYLILKMKELKY